MGNAPNSIKGFPNGKIELVLQTQEDADNVVAAMESVIKQYKFVSMADLLTLVGLPISHLYNHHIWKDLSGYEITQKSEGYLLTLPPLEEL